jgi:hypothetical protein
MTHLDFGLCTGVYVRDYARNGCKLVKDNSKEDRIKDLIRNGTVRTCNSFWRPQVRTAREEWLNETFIIHTI